jgi:uncharacterized iron-regulated protein
LSKSKIILHKPLKWPCVFLCVCVSVCMAFPLESKEQIGASLLDLQEHELNDKIYDIKNSRFTDKVNLLNSIADSKYILLGETHDNLKHHENQAWVIDELARLSFSTSVSFEMIDDTQGELIAGRDIKTSNELIKLLNHYKTAWQYEDYYKVLFDSVLQAGLNILPANIERQKLYSFIRHNKNGLSIETEKLMAEISLTAEMENNLRKEIIESHCGMIDQESAEPMMNGQRVRDATMALSLLNADADKRVLIAGRGHVRNDRGVPVYLSSQDKEERIISVALLEVEQDNVDIASYQTHWDTMRFPFDYVWFTARASREDPCLSFKTTQKVIIDYD